MTDFGYLFPVSFVGMFVLVIYVLSKKGWSDLANEYRFDETFKGDRVGVTSIAINGVSYNNCLVLRYNEQGFYLKPFLIFRLFHPPIFIPWEDVKHTRDKKLFFIKMKELVIGEPTIAIMQLKPSTFAKMEWAMRSKTGVR